MAFQCAAFGESVADPLARQTPSQVNVTTSHAAQGSSLIAQSTTGTASSEALEAAVGSTTVPTKKLKGELLITDSLWGNLILDLAYQRDPVLQKINKELNLLNLGTMGLIAGVAGGTLAQGVIALSVLNPPPPKSDSYLPGSIGVGMSGLTMVTLAGRSAITHTLTKKLRSRQLDLKHRVEGILTEIENSHGENPQAQIALNALIGPRATKEWLQLWRSSNQLASIKQPRMSANPPTVNAPVELKAVAKSVALSPAAMIITQHAAQ
jgi:hypothetical protein